MTTRTRWQGWTIVGKQIAAAMLVILIVGGTVAIGVGIAVSNYLECRAAKFSILYCVTTHVWK